MKFRPTLLAWLAALTATTGVAVLHAAADYSSPYAFTTLAGVSSIGDRDGAGVNARFYSPREVVTDAAGNAYIADEGNHTIRKITPTGTVSTFAGTAGEPGTVDGSGNAARFDSPQGLAIDGSGNLYVADTGNHAIRKITPAGVVSTFAGLVRVSGNADGNGTAARFNRPRRIAIDTSGNLYVTEAGNNDVRKITPAGVVSTFATSLKFPETADLDALTTVAYGAIAVDAAGNVYVAAHEFAETDSYLTNTGYWWYTRYIGYVHQLTPSGGDNRIRQTSIYRYYDGRIENAAVSALGFSSTGQLTAAVGYQIGRLTPGTSGFHDFTPLAGDGTIGGADGAATSAKFGFPLAFAYDRNGNLLIADTGNNVVRKISGTSEVSTFAGLALERATGTVDGTGETARFASPAAAVVDTNGNLYVTDPSAHCVRKITAAGTVSTLAGTPGQSGVDDGVGSAAKFNRPTGLALGPDGALYVSDTNNHTIRRISPDGTTTTFAGLATATGWYDGPRLTARFMSPSGLAFDATGNLYVCSAATVRKITPAGDVSTLAGLNAEFGYVDGTGSAARFTSPYAIAVDAAGNLYVSEAPTSPAIARIRKITPAGVVTTLTGAEQGYTDGALANARFNVPSAIAIDANNNLFVADWANQVVRRISASGAVTTIAGLVDAAGHADGVGREARFYFPRGLALGASGTLYVTSGTTVRKGVTATSPIITTQPASQSVASGASVSLSVVASGTPAPTFQWQFNGTAIAGATSATLTLSSARSADAGDYTVVVSNGAGSVTSNKATLTVNTPTTPAPSPSGTGGGGGGAPSDWFAACVASALLIRAWRQRGR